MNCIALHISCVLPARLEPSPQQVHMALLYVFYVHLHLIVLSSIFFFTLISLVIFCLPILHRQTENIYFIRTGRGTTDWFQIGKGVCEGCLFNLHAEYIMRNTGLDKAQAGLKIAGRNINNLRYADDTILMAESEEELKSLLMKVREKSEKVGLKLNIQQTGIMASGPFPS